MNRWVALLRGVNVGGVNRVPMADLRMTMEALGFDNVASYIQSGNLAFDAADSTAAGPAQLAEQISRGITNRHGLDVPVVIRSADQIIRIAEAHPDTGSELDATSMHVMLLDGVPDPTLATAIDRERYLPDRWTLDGAEIYLSYPTGSGRSKLTIDVFERALGVTATARNLNTVRQLAALAEHG
jgi:uncharacterized protein (DUF1697 family)